MKRWKSAEFGANVYHRLERAGSPFGGDVADLSQYSIATYERRSGSWRAAITPNSTTRNCHPKQNDISIVTPDDFESEPDAKFAAEKMIRKL
jgi:hypothetical protein